MVVSCLITTAGINGELEYKNPLCMLSNNIFNQYYFFLLWIWWVALLTYSLVSLVFRLLQLVVPSLSVALLRSRLAGLGLKHSSKDLVQLELKQWDAFLLTQVIRNLENKSKSSIKQLIDQMDNVDRRKIKGECDVEMNLSPNTGK